MNSHPIFCSQFFEIGHTASTDALLSWILQYFYFHCYGDLMPKTKLDIVWPGHGVDDGWCGQPILFTLGAETFKGRKFHEKKKSRN